MEIDLYRDVPFPFTAEWYEGREHAPHLEQWIHQPRMNAVAKMALQAVLDYELGSICDLGAGDGGMLSLLSAVEGICQEWTPIIGIQRWGYDLMQTNVDYAKSVRHQDVRYLDFVDEPIDWADLTIITECLEHLEDPHSMVRRIGTYSKAIIASSPASETAESHDECHAWVWDPDDYRALIELGGFQVVKHEVLQGGYDFQIILGVMP
jgi:2-polyprenyl-3-methyl-5-hydroxy-6-metoxy-1,4-benzoquinol methylase